MNRSIITKKSNRFISLLLFGMIVSLLFENIKLFTVLGASFKISHVFIILSIVYFCIKTRISPQKVLTILGFFLIPLFPLIRLLDLKEFFKSYFIWCLLVLFLAVSFNPLASFYRQHFKKYQKLTCIVFTIAEVLGIIQFISVNLLGHPFLINSFGIFQFEPSYINYSYGLLRCFSVFHEPSVLGWVSSSFIALLIYWKNKEEIKKSWFYSLFAMSILTAFCSISASSLYFIVLLILTDLVLNWKNHGMPILIGFTVVLVCLSAFTNLLDPMTRLFKEVNTPGTSGYERFASPILYASKTLANYPLFGRGIGQDYVLDKVGHIESSITSTVNNSAFEIVQNLGLSSIFVFCFFFLIFRNFLKGDKNNIVLIVSICCVFICTGAYLSADFLVICFITMANCTIPLAKKQAIIAKVERI